MYSVMEKDRLFTWLFAERKHGCISSASLLILLVFLPAFPIMTFGTIEHNGIKEPATFLLCIEICAPFVSLGIISLLEKKTSFSRAYFYSFLAITVISILYLGYKLFKHEHYYGYFGYDLVKALVFPPVYMGCLSLFFFIVENIVNTIANKRKARKQ